MPNPNETPAQRDARLARVAKLRGEQIAEWGEKDASDIAAKDRAAIKKRAVGPDGHQYGYMNEGETSVFAKRMGDSMSSDLEAQRRRDGKPTGYDAAMRNTPATSVSTADAMKADIAKRKAKAEKLARTPLFGSGK